MTIEMEMLGDLAAIYAEQGDEENLNRIYAHAASVIDTENVERFGDPSDDPDRALFGQQLSEYRGTGIFGPMLDGLEASNPREAQRQLEVLTENGLYDPTDALSRQRRLEPLIVEQTGQELAAAAIDLALPQTETAAVTPSAMPPPSAPTISGPTVAAAQAVDAGVDPATAMSMRVPADSANVRYGIPPRAAASEEATPEELALADARFARDTWRSATRRYGNPVLSAVAMEAGFDVADSYASRTADVDPGVLDAATSRLQAGGLAVTLVPDPDDQRLILADVDAAEAAISSIADPEVRRAAMDEFNAQMEERERAIEAARVRLTEELVGAIDRGEVTRGQLNSALNDPLTAELLGEEAADVRSYFDMREAGITPENEPYVASWLQLMAEGNPQDFARLPLAQYRGALDDTSFRSLTRHPRR